MIAAAVLLTLLSSGDDAVPRLAPERILLRTTMGDIVLALYPELAPEQVRQVLTLAREGVYDGTRFSRILPGCLVQISAHTDRRIPLTPRQAALIRKLPAENSSASHRRASLSMARPDGDPNGAESSFSLLIGPAAHLDGKYTVFGHVEQGLDVLEAVAALKSPGSERPRCLVEIDQARVVDSADALKSMALRPAAPAPFRPMSRTGLWASGLGLAVALALFLRGRRRGAKGVRTAGLLLLLVFTFTAFAVVLPGLVGGDSPLCAGLLLALVILLFRAMSAFESPPARSD